MILFFNNATKILTIHFFICIMFFWYFFIMYSPFVTNFWRYLKKNIFLFAFSLCNSTSNTCLFNKIIVYSNKLISLFLFTATMVNSSSSLTSYIFQNRPQLLICTLIITKTGGGGIKVFYQSFLDLLTFPALSGDSRFWDVYPALQVRN